MHISFFAFYNVCLNKMLKRVWMLEMALRGNGVKPIDSFIQITNGQDAIAWKTVNFELLKEDPPYDPRIISH